jgi:hypothetical protein
MRSAFRRGLAKLRFASKKQGFFVSVAKTKFLHAALAKLRFATPIKS